ncbi:unnamed protein product [Schistosoma bovis]|nr:unnamed protein product [Schistosoma haematobium]CAH8445876.1 unnamed protein product [Schistosoma curassoni]CAH8479466.1 unnamed protein product [Schistosoma bovis]
MLLEPSLYSINSILILDSEGKRILTKYYDSSFPTVKLQLEFESKLFKKTSKTNGAEITLLDGATCVYRNVGDLYFYVVGDANENELLLVSALQCLYDSVSQALKRSVEKKTLMDNLDLIFLIVDELCHNGVRRNRLSVSSWCKDRRYPTWRANGSTGYPKCKRTNTHVFNQVVQ